MESNTFLEKEILRQTHRGGEVKKGVVIGVMWQKPEMSYESLQKMGK
jgi:hypothetical protein